VKYDQILFPPFRLDISDECLWRGTERITLRRKTFAVLRYLVEHAHKLVTKEELLGAVWSGVHVGEKGARVCVREIRWALEEDPAAPRFIETVRGRGYRFIAPVLTSQNSAPAFGPATSIVGREAELEHLQRCLVIPG
jgi:DNA-binding winged helix-turn-helix (wHTH) protein